MNLANVLHHHFIQAREREFRISVYDWIISFDNSLHKRLDNALGRNIQEETDLLWGGGANMRQRIVYRSG